MCNDKLIYNQNIPHQQNSDDNYNSRLYWVENVNDQSGTTISFILLE